MEIRLKKRKNKIWSNSYIIYTYLWTDLISFIKEGLYKEHLKILDVGCGNKPYKDLFDNHEYIGMDWTKEGTSADIIGTGDNIPFDESTFDIVFSTQVLEHVSKPEIMISECYRVLKNDGIFICSLPFVWPLHETPYDFHRFTKYGIQSRLQDSGFKNIYIKANGGTWAQIFQSICLQIPKWLFPFRIIVNIFGVLLDKLFYKEDFPLNYVFTARK
jgi:SAM-dependent methyltransferase